MHTLTSYNTASDCISSLGAVVERHKDIYFVDKRTHFFIIGVEKMADKDTVANSEPQQDPKSDKDNGDGSEQKSTKPKLKKRSPDKGKKVKKGIERRWDWPKKNYFEELCFSGGDGAGASKMKNLVHRLVYIGKLRDGISDRNDVGNHHDKLIKNLQNNFQTEPMSGLLLVYLKHIVHVVEASSDMITEIMRDVQEIQRGEGGFLEAAKILVISHDVSTRLYQTWNFRLLDIQTARMEAYESSEGADKIIIDMLAQLLKLGNKLAITPKISFKSTLDSLHEKFPDLLPQQGHLHYLMEENDSAMILPEEYLDMYQKPFDIVLESEMVWPLPTKLFPYN